MKSIKNKNNGFLMIIEEYEAKSLVRTGKTSRSPSRFMYGIFIHTKLHSTIRTLYYYIEKIVFKASIFILNS